MKEMRSTAHVAPNFGATLEVSALISVRVKGSSRDITTGVKFEQAETSSAHGVSAFVDLDEIDELLNACTFIRSTAAGMANERRDYTEVLYSTRDDFTIGFYQDDAKQQAFVRLGTIGRSLHFGIRALDEIQSAIVLAIRHVTARRAAWDPPRPS